MITYCCMFPQGVGMGYFFDNWRRKTHPHVWILNTPVLLWYIADKVWCCTEGRCDTNIAFLTLSEQVSAMVSTWPRHPTDAFGRNGSTKGEHASLCLWALFNETIFRDELQISTANAICSSHLLIS